MASVPGPVAGASAPALLARLGLALLARLARSFATRNDAREAAAEGLPRDAAFGDDRRHELVRGDVEGGVEDAYAARRHLAVEHMRHLARGALLDRDLVAGGTAEVDRGGRRGDVERNRVAMGEHGKRVRADLVGDIAVGCRTIRSDHHAAHLAALHEVPGHVVSDERNGDAVLLE